jgi:hypothetical protein
VTRRARHLTIAAERGVEEKRAAERDDGIGMRGRVIATGDVTTSRDEDRDQHRETLSGHDASALFPHADHAAN